MASRMEMTNLTNTLHKVHLPNSCNKEEREQEFPLKPFVKEHMELDDVQDMSPKLHSDL